jgi:hypothetical protein
MLLYMTLLTLLFIIVFLIGLYFYTKQDGTEGFVGQPRCPNILIQKDSRFYLYNSKVAKVPGVNPVEFENLEDYTEFLDWQRSQGIRCPVLFLQQTYDAQGHPVFKVRPGVSEPLSGTPPSTLGIPDTPAYTQLLMDITQDTQYHKASLSPSDRMTEEQGEQPISPDPMDPNWGGAEYTQSLVDKGYYAENEITHHV